MIKSASFVVSGYGTCNLEAYIPDNLVGTAPAIVFIPGNGEVGTNRDKLYLYGPLYYIKARGWKPNFIVVGIQPLQGWAGPAFVTAAINELKKPEYKISSFALTGFSGGAYSTITYAQSSNAIPLTGVAPIAMAIDNQSLTAPFKNLSSLFLVGADDSFYGSMEKFNNTLKSLGYKSAFYSTPGGHTNAVENKFYDPATLLGGKNLYDTILPAVTQQTTSTSTTTRNLTTSTSTTTKLLTTSTSTTSSTTTSSSTRTIVGNGGGNWFSSGINPGDTIVLKGKFTYFSLGNIRGTKEKPITITNDGLVELENGFGLESCEWIKIIAKEKYGFLIKSPLRKDPGVSITLKSAHIEVANVEITNKDHAFWIKNEEECDETVNYPNWWIDDIYVHDCYIHDVDSQGFYMGSTDPSGTGRVKLCNGVELEVIPTRLRNIRIINNIIDKTGRPGIQLSGAAEGNNEIAFNRVSNTGRQLDDAQGTGISLGGYTKAHVHDNYIRDTYSWGIASLGGSGLITIENNDIDGSGKNDLGALSWPSNILIDTRVTIPTELTTFVIRNNKLGSTGINQPSNIYIGNTNKSYSINNKIENNTVGGQPAKTTVEQGVTVNGALVDQSTTSTTSTSTSTTTSTSTSSTTTSTTTKAPLRIFELSFGDVKYTIYDDHTWK